MEDKNQEITEEQVEETTQEEQQPSEENRIAELEEQLASEKDQRLRLFAEFDNFRKRTAKERIEFSKVASKDVLKDFLPVLDDINRAHVNIDASDNLEAVKEGVDLILDKLWKVLSAKGLAEMKVKGEAFNPDLHEAITEIPAPSEDMKGKIVDVVEQGYTLNEVIIRYPKVVVGK